MVRWARGKTKKDHIKNEDMLSVKEDMGGYRLDHVKYASASKEGGGQRKYGATTSGRI